MFYPLINIYTLRGVHKYRFVSTIYTSLPFYDNYLQCFYHLKRHTFVAFHMSGLRTEKEHTLPLSLER